jgi:hypothetical protein
MAGNLDSQAVFEARAKEIGLAEPIIRSLKAASIGSYATFAYSSSYVPGSGTEDPFIEAMKTCLGRDATGPELAILRRLVTESYTLVLSDMRSRIERGDESGPKRMGIPERNVRLDDQKTRLGEAIDISNELEPSFWLVDEVEAQREENVLRWINPEKCCSRVQELAGLKKETQYEFHPPTGTYKAKSADPNCRADLSGELLLRNALVRRALAYDQSGLLSFKAHMSWVDSMFYRVHLPAIQNYSPISISQCLSADRELWMKLSERLRGKITPVVGAGKKPLDDLLAELSHDPQVTFLMLPIPALRSGNNGGSGGSSNSNGNPKGNGKGGGGGKKPTKKPEITKDNKETKKSTVLPSEISSYSPTTPDGKYICWAFNMKGCKFNAGKRGRCQRGMHVCIKCHSPDHSVKDNKC